MALIKSLGGVVERTERNGDVLEMLHLIKSIVSVMLIKIVPVQESMWNYTLPTSLLPQLVCLLVRKTIILTPSPRQKEWNQGLSHLAEMSPNCCLTQL